MNQREVILIFGQTGSGKSYLARELARSYHRVLIADSGFGDFAPIEEAPTYDDLLKKLEGWKAFEGKPFRVSYDFRPEEYPLAFSTVLYLRDTLLVLEEGDRFDATLDEYREVIFRGRHYGVHILIISLHPRAIPTDLRRQATKIISFRQIFPDDLDWLAEMMGDEAYKLVDFPGPPSAPPHPYMIWTPLEGTRTVMPYVSERTAPILQEKKTLDTDPPTEVNSQRQS